MDDDELDRDRAREIAVDKLRDSDSVVLLDRSGDPDPWTALRAIRGLRGHLDDAERRAVGEARAEGATWSRIGEALGCSRHVVESKHRESARSSAVDHHPSRAAGSARDQIQVLEGGLDRDGVVLPGGRWVAHDDLTPDDLALIAQQRGRLSAVPREGPGDPPG